MARKRKTEVKTSDKKEQAKPLAVRKSSRQRMKKQLEEDVNGETVSTNVNSEDCKYSDNDNSQESTKKEKAVPKKATRHKNLVGKEKSTTKCKSVHGESSNDQDNVNVDSDQVEKEKTDEKQILVSENVLNEVVWPEDVIEETIICEEMEVDGEVSDHCSAAQDGNIVLEQVLLVNDSNFEGKDIVEYTLIQTDSPAEPHRSILSDHNMECTPTLDDSCKSSNSYEVIEQGLSILHMSDTNATFNESKSITESGSFDNNQINTNFCDKESSRSLRRSGRGTRVKKTNNQTVSETSAKKRTESCNKKNICSSEDQEKSIKAIKNNSVTSIKVNETNNTQSSLLPSRSILLAQEDDNSSSMSEKTDNSQEVTNVLTNDLLKDNKFVNNSLILEQKNVSNIDSKTNLSTLVTSKNLLLTSEEHSRDSELDTKVDSEDTKASSSSENSNDTLLSSNSSKNSDINSDKKSLFNQLNETDKKSGFRSRSGSTDTTESENGSNSSGVRRSSRIRTIGLMKPRSRGRGLVTKPSVDSVKTTVQQERDKFISNIVGSNQEKSQNRDGLDNLSETSQSDKENNSNKTIVSQDILTPLTPANGGSTTSGYDSDSNKPVKVKSRWRRSSELEMGNSESWSTARANLNFPNSIVTGISTVVPSFVNDTSIKLPSLPVNLSQEIKGTENQDLVSVSSQSINPIDSSSSTIAVNSMLTCENTSSLIPSSVGAKMFLPMVSSVEDREMEERLSQFEHLKENLYLTERYTNKETKRMLCDCFLTDEEILRGELGCGEDCLNRLLMIECGPRCVVGDRCTNKRFQNCDYADCEVFRTEKKGFGLRATSNLNAGDFIMEYVGEVVNPKDFRRRAKEYSKDKNRHYYFMALKSDQIIDATMKGNVSRFINHSCDPNAETQKWTVNGELRIGFFIKKFVFAGEEITFDYHFQRYGKEAQKCFCEATNCRGWIGDNPEENKEKTDLAEEFDDEEEESEDETEDTAEDKEDDKENKDKKPRRQVRKKKAEKKVSDHMEDEDLEEQVDKLCATGLKNRAHTLTLSRLMVRSREIQHRTRLLKVIQSGEQPCRRLFLDYHGLRLMWSYMMDVAGSATEEAHQFRLEVIKTLSTLPIPNKTMLIDSKVLSVIEKWSKQVFSSSSGDSPDDDQTKSKLSKEDVAMVVDLDNFEKFIAESTSDLSEMKKPLDMDVKTEIKEETVDPNLISELANNLLLEWSNLKEVFRIPKKERIEQMKEHEREADRGYKENVEKESKENNFYDRYRSERRNEAEKRLDRLRRGRDSPDFEHTRSKEKRGLEERPNLVPVPRMSKFERRQLFAMKVAKEEEERQRRQHEDLWQQHETQCLALGLDPYTTAAVDTQTGYPLFFNPQLAQWQAYPIQDGSTPEALGQHCPTGTAMFVSASGTSAGATSGNVELVYPAGYTTVTTAGTPPIQVQNGSATIPVVAGAAATATPIPQQIETEVEPELLPPPPLDLPPKWKWARDKRGRLYYYHVKERVPQWLPPPPDHIAVQPDSSTSSESSEESSSSNDEEDDSEQQPPTQQQQPFATANQQEHVESMELDKFEPEVPNLVPETKKRRDGLVQERIISPRREEDRVDHKKYKEIKEKLRRQKERAKLKEHLEKIKKHRRSSKSKSYSKHNSSKFQTITSDMSPTTERKIKDTFRINMAEVMVHFLNPYRKSDCKQGRITNTEDFKHLARKLTHFVLAKELKHCKSVDELECNDNVKHKAKDFVRKYMSKYGAVYQKSTDED